MIRLIPVPNLTLGKGTNPMIDIPIHRKIDMETITTIGTPVIQIIEINDIETIDHEIIQTTDQNIKNHQHLSK